MNQPMELDVWKGDWGLASIDLDCLRVLALCKFSGATFKVNIKTHPLWTPNGQLPVFRHYKHVLCTYDEIYNYLDKKNFCADYGLDDSQKADVIAFTMFLKENLYPAYLHICWIDGQNWVNVTRKWFCKTMPFPLSFFYPDRYHKWVKHRLECIYPDLETEQELENEIFERALDCLTAISHRLGTQEYIFGAHPTSIDATLYAYLAPIVKAPFTSNKLRNHLSSLHNLQKYVHRISQRYFAAENQAYEYQRQQEHASNNPGQIEKFPHKRLSQFVAAVFAVVAMASYGISTGLLQVNPSMDHRHMNLIHPDDEDEN